MSQLEVLLDRHATTSFPDMTFVSIRDIARELVSTGSSDATIQDSIQRLSPSHQDTLMKVLYCCMENDYKYSATYFRWHANLHAAAGSGAIIRVLTDRKR